MSHIKIEVCVTSVEDAIAAHQAGADRLELNAALALDGLTPSPGMIRNVRAATPLPIIAMIRPRAGHFVVSESDFRVMQFDIVWMFENQSSGVALGILTEDRQVDVARCGKLRRNWVGEGECVFHRAFDLVADPFVALEQLIDLGFTRIMTSGGQKTALEGADRIRELIDRAKGRIEILPAGGINADNVAEILRRTGCTQVHGSFRRSGAEEGTDASVVAAVRSRITDYARG